MVVHLCIDYVVWARSVGFYMHYMLLGPLSKYRIFSSASNQLNVLCSQWSNESRSTKTSMATTWTLSRYDFFVVFFCDLICVYRYNNTTNERYYNLISSTIFTFRLMASAHYPLIASMACFRCPQITNKYILYIKHEAYSALFNDDDDDEARANTQRSFLIGEVSQYL